MKALHPVLFPLASASPLVLLGLALVLGGGWIWVALVWIMLAALALDMALPFARRPAPEVEFPGGDGLLVGTMYVRHCTRRGLGFKIGLEFVTPFSERF